MKPKVATYARARATVLEAQQALIDAFEAHGVTPCAPPQTGDGEQLPEPDDITEARSALAEAHEALRNAEAPLAEDIGAAWEANRQAVADALAAAVEAHNEWAQVAVEVSTAARNRRARPEHLPVLTDEEKALVDAAGQRARAARDAHAAAQLRFKDGVTADQLAEVG